MRLFAILASALFPIHGLAQDAVDIRLNVRGPDGKPVAGADVWLVTRNSTQPHFRVAAQTKTDAEGKFVFDKSVIGPLWKKSVYPQIVARDSAGRIGSQFVVHPGGVNDIKPIALREVGEVRGRIVDSRGQAVAGAKIEPIQFARMRVEHQFAEPTYLPADIAGQYAAESAADGSFVVRGVPTGARVTANVRAAQCADIQVDWDASTALELRMPSPTTVTGRITGEPATERTGWELMFESANVPQQIGKREAVIVYRQEAIKTDAEGGFRMERVPPGRYVVRVVPKSIGAYYLESVDLEVKDQAPPPTVELAIKPSRKVRGRVVDSAGAGVPGVAITLGRFTERGGTFGRQPIALDSESVSGSDGWFEGYVVPGSLVGAQIKTLPEGYAYSGNVQLATGKDPGQPLPPLVIEKIEPLIVLVVDGQGKPVAGANVAASGPARFFADAPKPSGADGVVKLLFIDRGENATLKVTAGDAVSLPLPIDPAEERGPLTIAVSPENAFRFKGQVVDRAGQPIAQAEVPVMHSVSYQSKRQPGMVGSGAQSQTLITDSEGRFSAGPFVPGDRFSITAKADGYRPMESNSVVAEKGATHDFGKIVLSRTDVTVRGRVVDANGEPLAGARVVNSGDAQTRLLTNTAADGTFELRGLTSGIVRLVAFKNDFTPAHVAFDTDRPGGATIVLRRVGTPNDPPLLGIDDAAVRAAGRKALEALWECPQARKSPVDKKVVELMSRLDAEQARRWSGKPAANEPTIDELVESDLDEALAQLAAREVYAACRELKRLAEKLQSKDPAKSLRLAEEMAARARSVDPRYRPFALADAGRLLAQLGRPDSGRKLVEAAATHAESLAPSDEWNRYSRGHAASRLAPFDLARAKALLEGASGHERNRFLSMCANGLATTDPAAAMEMLKQVKGGFQRDRSCRNVAFLLATKDLDAALRVLELGEGSTSIATAYGWLALAIAPRDKAAAHRLIDRGFSAIHDRSGKAMGWHNFGGWGEAAASLALFAVEIGYPDRAALAAHVIAERPTAADVSGELRAFEANVGLAIMLAPFDRAAARSLLETAETRQQVIGSGGGNIRRREYLTAWALVDPDRALPLLLAEIDKLRAANDELSERSDIMAVLSLMTTHTSDRVRAMARHLRTGWPGPEEIE